MIYIARNRDMSTHSFFKVLDSNGDGLMPEKKLSRFINALVSAKGHKQLVSAIEECPCLLFQTNGGAGQSRRMLTAEECIEEIQANYVPTDARKLTQEMYMLSPKQLRANSSKESPAVAFDAYSCDFIGMLKQMDPETKIAVEPVQDWMTFRNLLAVTACILANIENLPSDGRVLKAAGFTEAGKDRFGLPSLGIPFKHKTALPSSPSAHPAGPPGPDAQDADYLLSCYKDDEFIESPADWGANLHLLISQRPEESQVDMAKRFVIAVWEKTQSLVDLDGKSLGMTQDMESLFDPEQDSISYIFHSLVSQSFNMLCYHPGRKLVVCKHCGNGVLASKKGKAKEFCSDSCRAQYVAALE